MDHQLLSDLCTICHTEKPKYRCPRCRAQTCSLHCYKRHQQRASCSGKRDPAAYVKKSQWATPTGIDRDYNYLKGVERTVHDAHQNVSHRGIGVEPSKSKVALRAWQPNSAFQQYLNEHGITIEHAPKGMSRQKNNHTRTTKTSNVMWTVEWASLDKRNIQHDCLASQPLVEMYSLFQVQSRNAEKRRLKVDNPETKGSRPKRRRAHSSDSQQLTDQDITLSGDQLLQRIEAEEQTQHDDAGGLRLVSNPDSSHQLNEQSLNDPEGQTPIDKGLERPPAIVETLPDTPHRGDVRDAPFEANDNQNEGETLKTQPVESENHYYLLKPSTPGISKILIPLDASSCLTTALRGQVVQEFPTIYVLENPPGNLPDGFLLEAEYVEEMKSVQPAGVATSHTLKVELGADTCQQPKREPVQAAQDLDPSSILEMLKRDMAR